MVLCNANGPESNNKARVPDWTSSNCVSGVNSCCNAGMHTSRMHTSFGFTSCEPSCWFTAGSCDSDQADSIGPCIPVHRAAAAIERSAVLSAQHNEKHSEAHLQRGALLDSNLMPGREASAHDLRCIASPNAASVQTPSFSPPLF
jgi:hypothetical protein